MRSPTSIPDLPPSDVGARDRAAAALARMTENVPGEPAGWANLALLQFSMGREEQALRSIERAQGLAPENGRPRASDWGIREPSRPDGRGGFSTFRRATNLAGPSHLKAGYALARELERKGDTREALAVVEGMLGKAPRNLALLLERIRLASKTQDADGLRVSIAGIAGRTGAWPETAKDQARALANAKTDFRLAARQCGISAQCAAADAFLPKRPESAAYSVTGGGRATATVPEDAESSGRFRARGYGACVCSGNTR